LIRDTVDRLRQKKKNNMTTRRKDELEARLAPRDGIRGAVGFVNHPRSLICMIIEQRRPFVMRRQ